MQNKNYAGNNLCVLEESLNGINNEEEITI